MNGPAKAKYPYEYKKFLDKLCADCQVIGFGDSSRAYEEKGSGRSLVLRHDVDRSLDHALQMAAIEYKAGIRSTYFILHTAPYFNYSLALADQVRRLRDMGHWIGLHHNTVTLWLIDTDTMVQREISQPLRFLREECGAAVQFVSSHGDMRFKELNYNNYHVWESCPVPKILNNPTLRLEDFGLRDEVYFMKRHFYISDSGGAWRGIRFHEKDDHEPSPVEVPFERDLRKGDEPVRAMFLEFKEADHAVMHLLIHPIWWK